MFTEFVDYCGQAERFLYGKNSLLIVGAELKPTTLGIYTPYKPCGDIYYNEDYFINLLKKDPAQFFRELADTIPHEAVHLLNDLDNIKDTDPKTGYHNKAFRDSVEKYGLKSFYANDTIGYSSYTPCSIQACFLKHPLIVEHLEKYAPIKTYT